MSSCGNFIKATQAVWFTWMSSPSLGVTLCQLKCRRWDLPLRAKPRRCLGGRLRPAFPPGVPQHQEPHLGRQPGLRPRLPLGHGQHHALQLPPGLASPFSPHKEDQVSEVQFMVQPHNLWLGLQQKVCFSECFIGCLGVGVYNIKCLILSFVEWQTIRRGILTIKNVILGPSQILTLLPSFPCCKLQI